MGADFDLRPAADAVSALGQALERFHAAIADKTIPLDRINATNRALARVLIPVNYTRGPRFTHDPALNVPPLPTIAEAGMFASMPEDQKGFTKTQLLRGRNRLVAALRDATRTVEAAL